MKLLTRRQQTKANLIHNAKGKLLTEDKAIHKRWPEYCTEPYNCKLKTDASIVKSEDDVENRETEDLLILEEDIAKAVRMLKDGKSPGVDNIPAEILKHGGSGIVDTLTVVCQKIWTSGQWIEDWTKSVIILLPKKGSTRLFQNYRKISVIKRSP